jgi:hypothetical protein
MAQNSPDLKLLTTKAELAFMYKKYEQLCAAYKKLAEKTGQIQTKTVHDMSQMSFTEYSNKENKEE